MNRLRADLSTNAMTNGHGTLGPIQKIDVPMRRFGEEEVDYVIVGVGSAGGVLLQRLSRAGFRVLGLEAGPFWNTERDWVSDEAGSHNLYWEDLRITGGDHPLALGANNIGTRCRRRLCALGGFHPAPASFGLSILLARRRRRRLADKL